MLKDSHQLKKFKFIGFDWKALKPSIEHESDDLRNILFTSNRDLIKRIENKFIEEKVEQLMIQRLEEELETRRGGESAFTPTVPPLDIAKMKTANSVGNSSSNDEVSNPWGKEPLGFPKRPLRPKPSAPSLVSIRSKMGGVPHVINTGSSSARSVHSTHSPKWPLASKTARSPRREKLAILKRDKGKKVNGRDDRQSLTYPREDISSMSLEDRTARCKEQMKQINMLEGIRKYRAFLLSTYEDSRLPQFMVDLEDEIVDCGEKKEL